MRPAIVNRFLARARARPRNARPRASMWSREVRGVLVWLGSSSVANGNRWRNWGRNQSCAPIAVDAPASVLELREIIGAAGRAGQTVRVAATGHSFSDIVCTDSRMLRLEALDRVLEVDRDRKSTRLNSSH